MCAPGTRPWFTLYQLPAWSTFASAVSHVTPALADYFVHRSQRACLSQEPGKLWFGAPFSPLSPLSPSFPFVSFVPFVSPLSPLSPFFVCHVFHVFHLLWFMLCLKLASLAHGSEMLERGWLRFHLVAAILASSCCLSGVSANNPPLDAFVHGSQRACLSQEPGAGCPGSTGLSVHSKVDILMMLVQESDTPGTVHELSMWTLVSLYPSIISWAFCRYTRIVLNLHTETLWTYTREASLSLSLLSSLLSSLSSLSATMTTNDHSSSRLSLCTHGSNLPECRSACTLAHSLFGEHVRITQETTVLVELCKPRATWNEVGLHLCWKWVLCLVVFVWKRKFLSSDPISSARVRSDISYLTSGKMKGRRKCWKIKMKKRKVKLMKKSRKSERTLNSCMRHGDDHGMEWDANANTLSHCAMCKGWVWQQHNRGLTRKTATLRACSRVPQVFLSRCTHCWVSCYASCWSCASCRQQRSCRCDRPLNLYPKILACFSSRKRVFWGVVFTVCDVFVFGCVSMCYYVIVCVVFVVLLVASVLPSMRWLLCGDDGSKKKTKTKSVIPKKYPARELLQYGFNSFKKI